MAVKLNEKNNGKILEVQVSGKLTHEDCKTLVPAFERLVKEHGKLRVLFEMTDLKGSQKGSHAKPSGNTRTLSDPRSESPGIAGCESVRAHPCYRPVPLAE